MIEHQSWDNKDPRTQSSADEMQFRSVILGCVVWNAVLADTMNFL